MFSEEQAEQLFGDGAEGDRIEAWKKYYECYAPYNNLYTLLAMMKKQIGDIEIEEIDGTNFYEYRNVMLENIFAGEKLSDREIAFHKKENERIETPYAYRNMIGYDTVLDGCTFLVELP